jgi:hypothetical protein
VQQQEVERRLQLEVQRARQCARERAAGGIERERLVEPNAVMKGVIEAQREQNGEGEE